MQFITEEFNRDDIQITDERLTELMTRFTPLYKKEGDNEIWKIEIPDLRNVAFTWSPKLVEKVKFNPVSAIQTSHSCGYYGFFKPSIAEVLAHVKDDGEDWGNAFFIAIDSVETFGCGEGHRAVTYFGNI